MIRCSKCLMPDTRPGIKFKDGVCFACLSEEKKKHTDWKKRFRELKILCNKHRRKRYYDCIVPVSGGKDSHYQISIMKQLKMNPLLVNVYNFSWTKEGLHNFDNMSDYFGCDTISLHLNRKLAKKLIWKAFVKLGAPMWYFDKALFTFPLRVGLNFNIPLIVYGENASYEYGGYQTKESPSAKDQIYNDVAKDVDFSMWLDKDIKMKDLNPLIYLSKNELKRIEPIYLSYYMRWNGYDNYLRAKKWGFKALKRKRQGFIDDYDQIDAVGYLIHAWLKYPKFGHARTTDFVSLWLKKGLITKRQGLELIKKHDHKCDKVILKDFLDFTEHTEKEFWGVVDRLYNKDLFKKINGKWVLYDD